MSTVNITIDIAKIHADADSVEKFAEALGHIQAFLGKNLPKAHVVIDSKDSAPADVKPKPATTKIPRPLQVTLKGGQHLKQHKDEDAEGFAARVQEAKLAYKARVAARIQAEKDHATKEKEKRAMKHAADTKEAHERRTNRYAKREAEADQIAAEAEKLAGKVSRWIMPDGKIDRDAVLKSLKDHGKTEASEDYDERRNATGHVKAAIKNDIKERVRKRVWTNLHIRDYKFYLGRTTEGVGFGSKDAKYFAFYEAGQIAYDMISAANKALADFRLSLPKWEQGLKVPTTRK